VRQIAGILIFIDILCDFLGLALTVAEKKLIIQNISFAKMKKQEIYFEMSAPNIFSHGATFFRDKKKQGKLLDEKPSQNKLDITS